MHFWTSYICTDKLDVQETNFSFAQFNRIRNHFFGCRSDVGWYCGRGKETKLDPMCKVLVKDSNMGEPTSFLDHVYVGCNQRGCQTSKDIQDKYRNMFESWISAGTFEKLLIMKTWRKHFCMVF